MSDKTEQSEVERLRKRILNEVDHNSGPFLSYTDYVNIVAAFEQAIRNEEAGEIAEAHKVLDISEAPAGTLQERIVWVANAWAKQWGDELDRGNFYAAENRRLEERIAQLCEAAPSTGEPAADEPEWMRDLDVKTLMHTAASFLNRIYEIDEAKEDEAFDNANPRGIDTYAPFDYGIPRDVLVRECVRMLGYIKANPFADEAAALAYRIEEKREEIKEMETEFWRLKSVAATTSTTPEQPNEQ